MDARLGEIYREYLLLLKDVEGEFNRVSSMFSERMQCRKGCSMCCSQLFGISFIEAAYISHGVKELDNECPGKDAGPGKGLPGGDAGPFGGRDP